MNKRKVALLAGLMTIGMVSFAADEKPLNTFNINDRVRFDENRLELNGNLHFNENNNLEIRVRDYSNVGNGILSDSRDSGNTTSDSTEMRLRLHTQTSINNMEVRTELKTNTYTSGNDQQYFRVQPTLHLFNDVEGLSSLVRAGVAFKHTSSDTDSTSNAYSISTSLENSYTINDYLSVEGNLYYDYTMGGKSTDDYNSVDIEAYVYANYPLYNVDNYAVTALLEGGFDPYSFGTRQFNNLTDASGSKTEGHETYVLYAEPSVKVTKMLNERNSVYLQGGYYVEQNNKNSTGEADDTAFARVGFSSKF